MYGKGLVVLLILPITAAVFGGCAGTSAPDGFLTSAAETQKEAYGAWAELRYQKGVLFEEANGELIALDRDSVTVLTHAGLLTVCRDDVRRLQLTTYDSRHSQLVLWTVLGTLSTISHGGGLAISAPVWILTGSIASSSQSYAPIKTYSNDGWELLRKYARYPQGLPPTIDRSKLREKMSSGSRF